ncbi:MAG TPA: O-antigen ligase family protein [Bacteroidales bacterium]|nr:O-antigen ligase family protein [Bacteroidales bacterium]
MTATAQHTRNQQLLAQFYFWGLIVMAMSLPLSRFMLSVSQFYISGILILEFMSEEKFRIFLRKYPGIFKVFLFIPYFLIWTLESIIKIFRKFLRRDNLPAIIFFSLYLLHVLGLLFTVDFDYALKDLRIKLPLLVLPVFFTVTPPLERRKFNILMLFFVAAVIVGTLISMYILLTQDVDNLRDISVFISHIRFGLLISIAIFTLAYFATQRSEFGKYTRFAFLALAGWLALYLLISASITGMVVLLVSVFVMSIHYTLQKKNIYSRIATVTLLLTPVILLIFIMGVISDVYKVHKVDFSTLDSRTSAGSVYWHDTTNIQTENGYYVWLYIATDEMRKAWNMRSSYDFDGKDNKGQELKFTLIRYLTSKGLRKDAMGVEALSPHDIALIEDGEASSHYHERSVLYIRLYKIIWEIQQYLHTGNPSGHSAMQRIEYWKTSVLIIRQHTIFGVGTGDMNIAFEKQYELMNSPLQPEFRWRSHNQFLSITVGFGLVGLIWFWIVLLYPPIKSRRMTDYFYLAFFVIMMVSMISEDTIETQTGVTIFAFFTSLFLFGKKDKTFI